LAGTGGDRECEWTLVGRKAGGRKWEEGNVSLNQRKEHCMKDSVKTSTRSLRPGNCSACSRTMLRPTETRNNDDGPRKRELEGFFLSRQLIKAVLQKRDTP